MVDVHVRASNQQHVNPVRADALWPRIGAAFGLAFVLLQSAALGFISSGGWLDPGASKADIVKAFAGTPASQLWIGAYLSVLAGLSFIPFTARVITAVRRADGASGWLSTTALAGGTLLVAAELGGAGALNALLARAGHELSAAVSLKFRALPRWLGGAAAVIAVVSLIAPASTQLRHVPATLFYLWVIAASVALIRMPREL